MMVTFCITMEPESKILATGWPSFSAIRMPMPISRAKTISGSTFTSAITCTGLCGTMESTISRQPSPDGSGTGPMSILLVSTPMPGWISVPSPSPSQTAIWPVTTKMSIARPPTAPSLRRSPIAATPDTSEKKISGTTSILIEAMNTSPMILMLSASGPQSRPVTIPRMSAAMTRCQSGIRNHVFSIVTRPPLAGAGR